MKKFILGLCLLSSSAAFAYTDYVCEVRQYQVELTLTQDTSTHMWLRERYEVLAHAYAGWVEKKDGKMIYHFYPGNAEPAQITFKAQDVIDLPEKLNGYIETKARGFLLWDRLNCRKVIDGR